VQADSPFRLRIEDIANLTVRNNAGGMIPLGTLVTVTPTVGRL
jgi:hydrophobic/amphiphilic exporter-1 (mainly G- bacteria), HAE1 family